MNLFKAGGSEYTVKFVAQDMYNGIYTSGITRTKEQYGDYCIVWLYGSRALLSITDTTGKHPILYCRSSGVYDLSDYTGNIYCLFGNNSSDVNQSQITQCSWVKLERKK